MGELEAIATAAAERLRALSEGDAERVTDLQRRVGDAAKRSSGIAVTRDRLVPFDAGGTLTLQSPTTHQLSQQVDR